MFGVVDVGAVAAELREADVVEHDEQDVGRAGRAAPAERPPRRRVPPVASDHSR